MNARNIATHKHSARAPCRQMRCCCAKPSFKLWEKFKARHDRLAKIIDDTARPLASEIHEFAKEDAKNFVDAVRINPNPTEQSTSESASNRRQWKDIDIDIDVDVD